jgi:hypothetical protein
LSTADLQLLLDSGRALFENIVLELPHFGSRVEGAIMSGLFRIAAFAALMAFLISSAPTGSFAADTPVPKMAKTAKTHRFCASPLDCSIGQECNTKGVCVPLPQK